MDIFPIVLIIFCFFVALLVLYALANDDFVLLRKHITITKIFDMAILTLGFALFAARLFYVISHFSPGFLNPLVFLLFPYFPGLSVGGGIIGGMLFIVIYSYKAKLAVGRIFDIFSLALFSALPVGLLMYLHLAFLLGAVISVLIFVFIFRNFQKGHLKDGSIGLLTLTSFSVITFLTGLIWEKDLSLLVISFVSTALLVRQEKL